MTKDQFRSPPNEPEEAQVLAARLTTLIVGEQVAVIEVRRAGRELVIEFESGRRLFADSETAMELSVT